MASAATINSWLDQLAQSIIGHKSSAKKGQRRRLDTFRRRVRTQQYARTNQFEVAERLTGMEEKFQILSREELSDELYQRRLELRDFEHQWLPDVLDLLLRLSGDPIKNSKLLALYATEPRSNTPPPITWKDLQEDDPVDRNDRLWRIPKFTEYSSDEDEITEMTPSSSPQSLKTNMRGETADNVASDQASLFFPMTVIDLDTVLTGKSGPVKSEIFLVREVLFMLRGLPCTVFSQVESNIVVNVMFEVNNIAPVVIDTLIQSAVSTRRQLNTIESWISLDSDADYVQLIKQEFRIHINKFYSFLDEVQSRIISPRTQQVVSLLRVIEEAVEKADFLLHLALLVNSYAHMDDVSTLTQLYANVDTCQLTNNVGFYEKLGSIFISSLELYLRPIWLWVERGIIDDVATSFPITQTKDNVDLNTLWQNGFDLAKTSSRRFPSFLQELKDQVFVCGKTAAFINHLVGLDDGLHHTNNGLSDFMSRLRGILDEPLLPFAAALEQILVESISVTLQNQTDRLKVVLDSSCGLSSTLAGLDIVYLRSNGAAIDTIETKIFSRIDHCVDSWNDRFLVLDMIEEVFKASALTIDIDNILVHAAFTSSRSMQSRRRSVKILGALAIEYVLNWPVANIIPKESLRAYQRVSLILQQIRRAKYILERIAYLSVGSKPVSEDATPEDQKHVQALTFSLLQFVNTIYDHLTVSVIFPATKALRKNLKDAPTFDEMIQIHHSYVTQLELSCFSASKLRTLREALVALLDMCIRFADLVSTGDTQQGHPDDSDIEASSFRSAQSRRRRRRQAQHEQDASSSEDDLDDNDEDGIGEGYSSFIVLEEDTTVMKEIRKLETQFLRQLDFFTAGLKGTGRGTVLNDEYMILAHRLAWKRQKSV